jgi:hypothetical protein
MEDIIWKQFRDYDYDVSTNGDVKNRNTGRVLKKRQQKEGYELIDLKKDKVNKTFRVHRIIAETFLGVKERGWEVDHINKIRNDNRSKNLKWVDKSDNSKNRIYCGILKEEIETIIRLHENGDDINQIYLKINKKIV